LIRSFKKPKISKKEFKQNMLSDIFSPKSIAIIGASTQPNTVGNDILKNLIVEKYQGQIYPVNPKASEILGVQTFANVSEIPAIPDMALIAVPAKIVPMVMEQVAQKGIKGAVIISAGFREVGKEGEELENQVKAICEQNNITLIGPNCLGVINPSLDMNASFANQSPPDGNIAFLSQSGAICTTVIDLAKQRGLGFSKFVSLGNKTLCNEYEMIRYLEQDDQTKVIMIYAEMLENGAQWVSTMKTISKPVIILKAGRTEAGASAASSHTGALASGDILFETLFEQANIIRADDMNQMFDLAIILSKNNISKIENAAIITNAGGPGVLTTDGLVSNGLSLAKISSETETELRKYLPPFANFYNPIDLIGDAREDRYVNALQVLSKDPKIDSILIILTPQTTTQIAETAEAIVKIKDSIKTPIVASFAGGTKVQEGIDILIANNISCCSFPDQAGVALAKIARWTQRIASPNSQHQTKVNIVQVSQESKEKAKAIFEQYKQRSEEYIPESDAKKIMSLYGITSAKSRFCATSDEAVQYIPEEFKTNLVMKIISSDIMHKSDVGGVMLDVNPNDAGKKFDQMIMEVTKNAPNAKLDGILFAEMIDLNDGAEFILGAKKDPNLGTAIMVGLGGIYVEVFKDVAFGFPPLSSHDIDTMIDKLASKHILDGARGQDKLDKNSLKQAISSLSQLLNDFPQITEVDLNPVLVMKENNGLKALDAKIVFDTK
jgi:acetate---CoA ligase (ADP-forming)